MLYPEQSFQFQDSPLYVFGIMQYGVLREYIQNDINNNDSYIDTKFASSMLDHKVLMKGRIEYIHNFYPFNEYKNLSNNIQSLIKVIRKMQMLMIKYNIKPSVDILQKVYDLSFEIEKNDKDFMECLLLELKNICGFYDKKIEKVSYLIFKTNRFPVSTIA